MPIRAVRWIMSVCRRDPTLLITTSESLLARGYASSTDGNWWSLGPVCGIAGAYSLGGELPADVLDGVSRMGEPLLHRGPDAAGYWVSPALKTALAATLVARRTLLSKTDNTLRS